MLFALGKVSVTKQALDVCKEFSIDRVDMLNKHWCGRSAVAVRGDVGLRALVESHRALLFGQRARAFAVALGNGIFA